MLVEKDREVRKEDGNEQDDPSNPELQECSPTTARNEES